MAQSTVGPHRGHAAGDTDIEKAASQLVSDIKYKVKKELSGATHMNPAQIARKYMEKLNSSSATGAVKALARKKLTGGGIKEEIMSSIDAKDMASDAVANALYRVFAEKKDDNIGEKIDELKEAYSKLNRKGERVYHIIVTDKKTGNTYTRDATREKIAELRANPNISSVEMSERRLDSEKEKSKGANTAAVKSGKGLDPVGQEDDDVNNDRKVDKTDEYLMKRRNAVGSAIAKRKGVAEEFIGEVKDDSGASSKKSSQIKPMGPGEKNNVIIAPNQGKGLVAHYDMQGNQLSESQAKFAALIQEKAESEQQQKLFGLALSVKRGETPRSEVSAEVLKIVDTMSEKKIRDFAKTKHEGLPKKKTQTEAVEPKSGGRAPTLPAAEKFIDELPGKVQQIFGAKTKPTKPVAKEAVEVEMDKKPKLKKSEGGVEDPRSIPTAINLAKNKLRAMGLKCSYEPEGEVIGESERREEEQRTYGVGGNPNNPRPERPTSAPTGPKKKPASPDAAFKSVVANLRAQHGPNAVRASMRTRKRR